MELETDSSGIVKPLSAFHHFSKSNSISFKEEMIQLGKDPSLGNLVAYTSQKWKHLSEDEKAEYERMAAKDKERYQKESELRDSEALKRQEEMRAKNNSLETDTRMRGTTLASTDFISSKSENPKRKREVSEHEREQIEIRRKMKREEDDAIKQQHDQITDEKAKQAEARLKYLLSQSDIFMHFGATKELNQKIKPEVDQGKRTLAATEDEMDEDEKAMAREIGEGDDEEVIDSHNTVLLSQPTIVTGGALRAYQLEGLNWMIRLYENGINGILADEMGLGKTLQSISVLAYLREYKNISGPHIVIVPKSTMSNWCNEFKRWCPEIKILKFHGSKDERQIIIEENFKALRIQENRPWDVVITSYEIVNMEKNVLSKIAWRHLIIDEAHRLKNEASQFSQTVRMLNTQSRLLLTGTPLQNNLHELWALLNFLLPDVFTSSEQFDEWFNLDIDDISIKERMISQLHKILRPFMLRRLKADVEKSLPPKSETILFTGMSTMQKNLYKQILMRDIDVINGATSSNSQQSRTAVLNIVMQLRKCCNHPYLFPGMEDRALDPMGDHLALNSGKMVLLDKLLGKMKERGHRVLIFSQMTRMLDILEDYLISKGYLYCRIDGNTTYEEREDRIYDFNREGSDKFVFILSTRAGGLGINLQTADTVILYDSDWNPQADLQAQDRAHRIGQKHPVQVFRLVTDDSVEVKVVERAQQKLKLDAMVVQQGRLMDKEKKMSKDELLDTLRFGADKVFRSKDSTITDADIDLILEEGRKRTEEMNEKLKLAEKGDIYDFRLDGGMGSQIFEGKDYSNKNLRNNDSANFLFIDTGKRERKGVVNYSETNVRQIINEEEKKPKLPRHLRLNKMEDWQFFDKARLQELQSMEVKLFDQMVEKGELPQSGNISKFFVLPLELQEEKKLLLESGFSDWTKVHYNNFIRASAKHGRTQVDKISKDLGRPIDEVKRYSEIFWARGFQDLGEAEWERVSKQIEKGEKRLEEISRLTAATAKLISMFEDPWEELTFKNVGNVNRIFTAVEDRFLLCLTHLHGYGSWEQVRNSIRRCERFRFDFYLQSCSVETLGKRCELLMRSAERELIEIEKKKIVEQPSTSSILQKNTSDLTKQRIADISKQISDESKRLANVRAQIQKIKSNNPISQVQSKNSEPKLTPEKKPISLGRVPSNSIPDDLLPELITLIISSGQDGIVKIIDKFSEKHPSFAKRQIEMKINEIAIKEKRETDSTKVWHLKADFEHLLGKSAAKSSKKRKLEKVETKEEDQIDDSNENAKEPKKFRRAFGHYVKAKRSEAESILGPDASKTDALKDLLTKMWDEADETTRKLFEKKEQEDRARYEKELTVFKAAKESDVKAKRSKN